ncbi:hypothetical protein KCP73_15700 [Salmonella enterica subsp. enterica]|nr:hypothetical protein KCP73_15700 [Salmonella enterica subsp. enterica]
MAHAARASSVYRHQARVPTLSLCRPGRVAFSAPNCSAIHQRRMVRQHHAAPASRAYAVRRQITNHIDAAPAIPRGMFCQPVVAIIALSATAKEIAEWSALLPKIFRTAPDPALRTE